LNTPLEGLRVLDCTIALAGPFASLILADLGADVIKIENPSPMSREASGLGAYKGESGHFLIANRNKRGMTIDLKSAAGKEIFYKLASTADILVQNFRPGVMERLGCGWEELHKLNPRLIYCSISGFGQGSPYSDLAGFDLIAQGMSGLMSVTGSPEDGEPVKVGTPVCDMGTGMYGVIGVLAALRAREITGEGQHVEATLLDTPISWLTWRAAEYWGTGEIPEPQGSGRAVYRAFRCSDDRWVNIGPSNKLWPKACETIGLPELITDERFTTPALRLAHHKEVTALYQEAFLKRTSSEWIEAFQEAGVPVGPIYNVADVLDDPHVHAREMVVEVDHPVVGKMKTLGVPVKLSKTPGAVVRAAPILGQHSREILSELNYSDAEIESLSEQNVI
jgi:crotonobetainyl-CoA:carnitine CoA-transferase CaiB-like acyl-CoA transferase